jgi:hypothetical protein
MEIIVALLVGLIVGAIAKFLMPGPDPGSWIMTTMRQRAAPILQQPHFSVIAGLAMICALAISGPSAHAASSIEARQIQFAKGASSATVKGTLKGDRTIDYKLRARAGQTMTVKLKTGNAANYFNVLPPGSKDVAIFVGSTDGNEWTGTLPADGEYTIRVYLMRSAARRNETANFALNVGIAGSPNTSQSLGPAPPGDAKVKGTPYHATGQVDCWMGNAPEGSSKCDFGVIRGRPGNAEVHIKPPGGLERVLTFIDNNVTSGSDKVKAAKSGDGWTIEVNDYEHYRVFEAVISGG